MYINILIYYFTFSFVVLFLDNIKPIIKNIQFIIDLYKYSHYIRRVNLYDEMNIFEIDGSIDKKMFQEKEILPYFESTLESTNEIIRNYNNNSKQIISFIINSDGGDYLETTRFISKMNELRKKKNIQFNCYSIKASSSAFMIFQYCDKRYVSPNTILFQHNVTIKIPLDRFEHFYENSYETIIKKYKIINKYISSKIGLSYEKYMKIIRNDWLIKGGTNIMKYNLADEIVIFRYKKNGKPLIIV